MTSNEPSLDNLPPSAQLARLHAQAASTNAPEQETFVPSPDDPVVVDSFAYEPLIAGDFPTPIGKPVAPVKQVEPKKDKKLDLSSESAFPSLSASASPRTPAFSGWSATASRVKAQPTARSRPMAPASGGQGKKASATQITDVLELPANQQIANLPNKPLGFKNSADVIQQVINKTGTNIIASTNRSGTTTFLIQGAPTDVARAKRELVSGLVVKRTVEISVPASTRRFIIGTQGKTLKQIEQVSGTRINFPRKEDEVFSGDPDEAVTVTIMGDAAGIKMAKEEIDKIVGEKTAKQTIKLEGLDNKYYLLLTPAVNALEEELDVKIYVPTAIIEGFNQAISISGDKEKVQAAKAALEKAYADLENKTRTVSVSIPKRQHKYLYGKNSETLKEIFNESGCTVELPPSDDPSENITVRGPEAELVKGLTIVMEKARAVHVSIYDLSENYKSTGKDALDNARYALKYLLATKSLRKIENDHNVQVGVPTADELKKSVALEFVSKVEKDAALAQLAVSSICHALTPSVFATVQVKPYLHQHISSRYGKQLERIQSNHKVLVIVPDAQEKSDKILFIFEGEDKSGSKAALDAASEELKKIVADSAEYISKGISIPAKFHDVVRGPRGTTLNAILGPDADVVVLFGTPSAENVEVRGLTKEVNRAIDALQKTYEAAKDEDFTKPYTTEFFIAPTYSAHIIGKSGIHINKLKDDLGVKVDIGENKGEEAEKVVTKGKKSTAPVKVVIQGVRVNVEAAKERIQTQVSSLADQVTISLKVPKEFHRFLIGPSGRYVKKLEDKYNVFIKFPKSNRGDDSPAGNPDEITVRGGKKDAASAKEELMELYEYEKEEQEKRKEREAKHRQYEEKRAAEEKKKAEEKAAKEAAAKESE